MSYLNYIHSVRDQDGVAAALTAACERIVQDNSMFDAAFCSQFLERAERENGAKFYRQVPEQYVSGCFDMADCGDKPEEFFWCDPATGELHRVTVGHMDRAAPDEDSGEMPFIYANSDLIANGQVVGSVQHTDH